MNILGLPKVLISKGHLLFLNITAAKTEWNIYRIKASHIFLKLLSDILLVEKLEFVSSGNELAQILHLHKELNLGKWLGQTKGEKYIF